MAVGHAAGGTLAPQASQQLKLTFTALSQGEYATSIRIDSNDPDEPSLTIPVTLSVNFPKVPGVSGWGLLLMAGLLLALLIWRRFRIAGSFRHGHSR